jgi:hypothetical protein
MNEPDLAEGLAALVVFGICLALAYWLVAGHGLESLFGS